MTFQKHVMQKACKKREQCRSYSHKTRRSLAAWTADNQIHRWEVIPFLIRGKSNIYVFRQYTKYTFGGSWKTAKLSERPSWPYLTAVQPQPQGAMISYKQRTKDGLFLIMCLMSHHRSARSRDFSRAWHLVFALSQFMEQTRLSRRLFTVPYFFVRSSRCSAFYVPKGAGVWDYSSRGGG